MPRQLFPTRTAKLLAASVLSVVLLASCSGASAAGEGPTSNAGTDSMETGSTELAGELTVFAAASLQEAFDELLADFGVAHSGVTIGSAVYDGSSTLVTQLAEGAEADVLATANEATMADAVAADVIRGEPELFATNALVIAVPKANPHGVGDLPDVLNLDYAICAEQVPCGSATVQLFDVVSLAADPISVEQNVTAVANRVSAGDVDAGFIYTTDVAARPELIGITPAAAQVINSYPVGVTSDSAVGAAFVEYVLSDAGASVLTEFGFGRP